jgi:hypothetical protein
MESFIGTECPIWNGAAIELQFADCCHPDRGRHALGWTHASWHLLGLKVFRCRAQWSIQTSDTWCTRCTSTARQQERSQDCGTIPVAATSKWGDGTILGTPQLATEVQMQTLRACKTCIGTRGNSSTDARHDLKDGRTGRLCPTSNQMMPLTGVCDNCSTLTSPVNSRDRARDRR